jgi:nucleotide-binding universal stress UspA family protein
LTSSATHENRPIIVGVDGSDRSADALALADVLAPALGCPVLVAFVHEYGRLTSFVSEGECGQRVREVAESTFERARAHLSSVPLRKLHLVAHDSPAAGLHVLAEREDAALIVIGSSHRSRIGRILPGGTGERLLAGAPIPVAVAPSGYADAAPDLRTVGCAYNATPESRHALKWAEGLARASSTHLHVIGVHETMLPATVPVNGGLPTSSLNDVLRGEQLEELARAVSAVGADIEVSAELLDGRVAHDLARASRQLDLLVVGSRGYGALRAVLLGSVSTRLVRSAESPLVVLPRADTVVRDADVAVSEIHA